jgi:hypothetical protein
MGYGLLKRYPKARKYIEIALDLLIFAFFVSGILLYSWAFRQGYNYAESWYGTNCICKSMLIKTNITPP